MNDAILLFGQILVVCCLIGGLRILLHRYLRREGSAELEKELEAAEKKLALWRIQDNAVTLVEKAYDGVDMANIVASESGKENVSEEDVRREVRILIQRGILRLDPDFRIRLGGG